MKKYVLLTVLVLFTLVNKGLAQTSVKNNTYPVTKELRIGTTYTFQKKSIHGQWKVNVKLPKGYEKSTDKYPVVYVLHGDFYFNFAVGGLQRLVDFGEIPEVIIIQLTYWSQDLSNNECQALYKYYIL